MITISNLKKQFGETVACDIEQLTINDGDILGLVGNNGAGKTTLFRLLLDLLQPDGGSVLIDNINPAQSEDWKQSVGAYIDEGFLIDFLTPEEYFAFLGKVSGMTQTEVDERLKDFEQFAAGEVFGQKKLIRNLSAGNRALQLPRPIEPADSQARPHRLCKGDGSHVDYLEPQPAAYR